MAIEDYWASTARNAKDIAQYAIYPVSKMLAMMALKDSHKANVVAGVTTTAFYSGLTAVFLGREMDGFDQMTRTAVAAETGKRAEDLTFKDFAGSENVIVQKRMRLFTEEHLSRYAVSVLPMLPTVMEHVARRVNPGMKPTHQDLSDGETRWRDERPKPNASPMDHLLHGWNTWDNVVYAGVATLWLKETYSTDKTFVYQGRKEVENFKALGLKIDANNIAGLYNRYRVDSGQAMIEDKIDRDKLWPLFDYTAKKMNQCPHFDLPELTYLMGLGKMDVFARDETGAEIKGADGRRVLDEPALAKLYQEINRIERIGLKGIAEEARQENRLRPPKPKNPQSFVARLTQDFMEIEHANYRRIFGQNKDFQEYISPRDPGEVPPNVR